MIEIQNLSVTLADGKALEPLTLTVPHGRAVALLGAKGAGKTVIMDLLSGNLPVPAGRVKYCGNDLAEAPFEAKACFGYMPAEPPLYDDLSVRGYLKFVGEARGLGSKRTGERIAELLELLDLRSVADKPLAGLSTGVRRLTSLAQALMGNPPVLLLDEPTAQLDPREIVQMRALLKTLRSQHALLIATRIVNEVAALCDEVLLLDQGKVAARGTPQSLATLTREGSVLCLRVKGEESTVRGAVESVEGAALESLETVSAYTVALRVLPKAGDATREALFWALSKAGCPVLEMAPERKALDELLLALVSERFDAEEGAHAHEGGA